MSSAGLTLIEVIVVIAILGILAAILVPALSGVLDQGDEAALNADVEITQLGVAEFRLERHAGPDGSFEWGTTSVRRLYPTQDGEVGDVELNVDEADPDQPNNLRVDGFVAGPTTSGTTASDAEITASLVWLGLLVNEPFTQSGAAQQTTGDARPKTNEDGEFLPDFPRSADAENTARDPSGEHTDGSYKYVVLHNGRVAAVYKSVGIWYAGFDDVYP